MKDAVSGFRLLLSLSPSEGERLCGDTVVSVSCVVLSVGFLCCSDWVGERGPRLHLIVRLRAQLAHPVLADNPGLRNSQTLPDKAMQLRLRQTARARFVPAGFQCDRSGRQFET